MQVLVATAAVAVLLVSASAAEARARFKFGSGSTVKSAPRSAAIPTATPGQSTGGSIVPGAILGASVAARAGRTREDLSTGSMSSTTPMPANAAPVTPMLATPASAAAPGAKPAAKPAFVCAQDRTVGAGVGFCNLN